MCIFPKNPIKALNPINAIKDPKSLVNPKTFIGTGGPKKAFSSALGDLKSNTLQPKKTLLGG